MKRLIRRLSRVADSSSSSSKYSLLRSDSQASSSSRCCRRHQSVGSNPGLRAGGSKAVPQGHLPVYVGEEMERFVVSAELLNHPVFVGLLDKSAQEYGYEQKGVLQIPCHVLAFERVMEALRLGIGCHCLEDLLGNSFFSDGCL
uniref:Uncharacterized protein n=1 Tax=Rhizophora mucronata TaxID=61149 RepID=A0A2P2Q2W4_RHIMU